jgi:hypothetical protein
MHVAAVQFLEVMLIEFYVNKICTNYVSSSINNNNNKEQTFLLIDIAIQDDSNVKTKDTDKLSKYKGLKIEVSRMWKVREEIVPVIIRALGTIRRDYIRTVSCSQVTRQPHSCRRSHL